MTEKHPFEESERFPQPHQPDALARAEQPKPVEPSEIDRRINLLRDLGAYAEAAQDAQAKLARANENIRDVLDAVSPETRAPENYHFSITRASEGSGAPEGTPQTIYGWDAERYRPHDLEAGEATTFSGDRIMISHDNFKVYVVNQADQTCVLFTPVSNITLTRAS